MKPSESRCGMVSLALWLFGCPIGIHCFKHPGLPSRVRLKIDEIFLSCNWATGSS